MKIRYSETSGCFYPFSEDYGGNLPADVIEVAQEDFDAAMARPVGCSFHFAEGKLVIAAPPPVPFSVQAAPFMAEVRETREAILNRLAGIGMAAVIAGDTSSANAIAHARQDLLDITEYAQVKAAIAAENLAALEMAVKDRYKQIAAAVPLSVRNAFNKVSQ